MKIQPEIIAALRRIAEELENQAVHYNRVVIEKAATPEVGTAVLASSAVCRALAAALSRACEAGGEESNEKGQP